MSLQKEFAVACRALATRLDKTGFKDEYFIRATVKEINHCAQKLCCDEPIVGLPPITAGLGITIVDQELGYELCYWQPRDLAELDPGELDPIVKLLYKWALHVENGGSMDIPWSEDRWDQLAIETEADDHKLDVIQEIIGVLRSAGVVSLDDEESRVFEMVLSKDMLAKRVSYEGDSLWGLLGATEEWTARLERPAKALQADKVDTEIGKQKETRLNNEVLVCGQSVKKQLADDPTHLTPRMVAEQLGVGVEPVLTWIHEGQLKAANVSNAKSRPRWLIAKEDVATFLESRSNQQLQVSRPSARPRKPKQEFV